MNLGKLEQVGTPEEVFHRPQSRFVADFVGQTDFLSGRVTDQGVETVLGFLPQRLPLVDDSVVEVAVRPDDVRVTSAADGGNGHIVERQFVGIAIIYTIALADGTHIHSWQPHTLNLLAYARSSSSRRIVMLKTALVTCALLFFFSSAASAAVVTYVLQTPGVV